MFAPERLSRIRKLVRQHRRMTFAEVQKQVAVSPATLRRDLAELEQAGDLIRVHGGILDPSYARSEVSFDERVMRQRAAKLVIAQAAAAMVPPGATVLVDAGSTCLEAGKALIGRSDVKLITHSVALLQAALLGGGERDLPRRGVAQGERGADRRRGAWGAGGNSCGHCVSRGVGAGAGGRNFNDRFIGDGRETCFACACKAESIAGRFEQMGHAEYGAVRGVARDR